MHASILCCRWLGVEHIFLTENTRSPSAKLKAQLRDFVDSGFLTHGVETADKAQMKVFYDCALQNAQDYNWLAFFDVDEFLILRRCSTSSAATCAVRPVLLLHGLFRFLCT